MRTNFIFCSFKIWIYSIFSLATSNSYATTIGSLTITAAVTTSEFFITESIFGTSRLVLLMVMGTVFFNTIFGRWKSLLQERRFFALAQKFEHTTRQHKLNIRKSRKFKFDPKRLFFVFFKCLSFLAYLAMVKVLTTDGIDTTTPWQIQALNLTTETLIRVPIAFFWYYEFKSIGDSSEFIFGKKALPFKIAEWIFEPRIKSFIGEKTPSDGNNDFKPPTR